MTLTDRDRRAILLLGFAVVGVLVYIVITDSPATSSASSPAQAIPLAERRLEKVRQLSSLVAGRDEVVKRVNEQLTQREKRVLTADTAAQAQAQLLSVIRRVAGSQNPRVDLRASEFGQVKPFGSDYGEVPVSVTFECGIEQLLNIMAELTVQQELVALQELRVYSANPKQKTTNVRMTVSAIVPRRLVPDRKGGAF